MARTAGRRPLAVGIGTVLIVAVSVAAALNGGALASGGTPGAGGAEIDSCTTIDEPGTYALTADVVNASADTCIEIRASDVVLNGNGHAIDGVQGDGDVEAFVNATFEVGTTPVAERWANHGVAVRGDAGASNVTVRNLQVTDWIYGVAYVETTGGTVENVSATRSATGVVVYDSLEDGEQRTAVTVADVTSVNNGYGVMFDNSTGDTLADSNASANVVDGVEVFNATNLTVASTTSDDNGFDGIYLQNASESTFSNNSLTNNSEAGVLLVESSDNEFSNNSIDDTSGTVSFPPLDSGAVVALDASGNVFRNTTVRNNSNWTYYAVNGSENTVTDLAMPNASLSFTSRDVALQPAEAPPAPPENRTDVGQFVNATNTSNDSYAFVNFSYADADVGQIDESSLRVWEYDDGWSRVAGTNGVDAESNVVFANVTNFSVFAPLGEAKQPTPSPTATAKPTPTRTEKPTPEPKPTATPTPKSTPTSEPPTATPDPSTPTDDGKSVEIEYLDCTSVRVTGNAGDVVVHTGFYDESGLGDQVLPLGPVNGSKVFQPDAYEGVNGFQIAYVEVYSEEYPRGERIASKANPNREQCDRQIRPDETATESPTPTPTPEPTPTPTPAPEPTPTPTPNGTTATVEYLDCHSVRVEGDVESAYVFGWDVATVDLEGDGTPEGFSENPFDESLGEVSGTTTQEYDERVQILSVFLYDRPVNDPSGGMVPHEFVSEYGEPDVRADNPRSSDCIQDYKGSVVTEGQPTPTPTGPSEQIAATEQSPTDAPTSPPSTPAPAASSTPAPSPNPTPSPNPAPSPTTDASAQAADATSPTDAGPNSPTDADSE